MTRAVAVLPLYRNVTLVPHGSVRWATPTVSGWMPPGTMPQAPPLPYRPGPYQLMLLSRCQVTLTTAFGLGSATSGRGASAAATGARRGSLRIASALSQPSDAVSGSRICVVIDVSDRSRPTPWKADGSMAAGRLGMRDPTSPETTTEASTAMSAERATTLRSRTSGETLPQVGAPRAPRAPCRCLAARSACGD